MNNNPWDIKKTDEREYNSLPTFIIFCEDKVSEPVYLKYFETSNIKINLIKEQKSMSKNVFNAITHCKENNLTELINGEDVLKTDEPQVWCVFDRDKEENSINLSKGDTDFDASIRTANSIGIKVAWSNDAFELWVLLHFEDIIDIEKDENKKRKTYYNKLTEIFRNLENSNDNLRKVKNYRNWNYKDSLKSEDNFRDIVRGEIVGKTNEAIKRAKELENYFKDKNIRNSEKAPCTLMHHLIEELIRLGKKGII